MVSGCIPQSLGTVPTASLRSEGLGYQSLSCCGQTTCFLLKGPLPELRMTQLHAHHWGEPFVARVGGTLYAWDGAGRIGAIAVSPGTCAQKEDLFAPNSGST